MRPLLFEHAPFEDYALLDSGAGEKLERFGPLLLRRPDPQALWRKRLGAERWEGADLAFERESDRGGRWIPRRGAPAAARAAEPQWTCRFEGARFLVRPTPFKHVGVFPEQAPNWKLVERARPMFAGPGAPRLLNLFGYTGIASVLAAQAGYEVTHVDASKTSIAWLADNAEASGLGRKGVRLICDDALAFARREVRRESRYQVVLLDPPAYGRGPKGEKWRFEEHIVDILGAVRELLAEQGLLILSSYAIGYSPLAFHNLLMELEGGRVAAGELTLPEEGGNRLLPAGYCARFWRARGPRGRALNMGGLDVLHLDNHLIVVNKPACVPCVPDESGDPSLLERAKAHIKREFDKPGDVFLGVVHRLDRPVSGVVVFARTSKAAARLTQAFRMRKVRKTYLAVLCKPMRAGAGEAGKVEHWLVKDSRKRRVRMGHAQEDGAKLAVTHWRLLTRCGQRWLVELEPYTGRPHQLRVAMASLGAPILGDLKYGAPAALPDKSIALHARRLEFPHPTRGADLAWEASPPGLDCWQF